MANSVVQSSPSQPQQLFTLVQGHLLERLRAVFEVAETGLLASGEQPVLCCELRRNRRSFIDNFLNQLQLRCEEPGRSWVVGSSASARNARTLIYLTGADQRVRALCQEQATGVGRLAALWAQQTGRPVDVLDCPLSLHTMARLFFLLLPDLPAPLRIRHALGVAFCDALAAMQQMVQTTIFNVLQRRGVLVAAITPIPLPNWWEPLAQGRQPSVAAQSLVVPPRSMERMAAMAIDVAEAALADDRAGLMALLSSERQTALLPWLLRQLAEDSSDLPPTARGILTLLAGPLLLAACEESFADAVHPARRSLEELMHWAPGWQECLGIEGVVPEYCREMAVNLARGLVQDSTGQMPLWLDLFDYLLQLRKRVQQDTSAVVASTRLSLQVTEVHAEVDALLAERAGLERWPQVVIDILHESWTGVLLAIHWREGTASDAWLSAIAVADELLASVQPGVDRAMRQRLIQRVPHLLQNLRRGFDDIGFARRDYSVLLQRLENVHLALLQGKDGDDLPESSALWPLPASLPASDEPFEVGNWLQRDDGSVCSVQFSDAWCTVLLDAHNAAQESCSTAVLQAAFYDGNLVVLPVPRPLLVAA